jgi:hypothetical protein
MHDIDRTQVGSEFDREGYGAEMGEAPLEESEAMELASELMEVNSEEDFENFLGDLISRAVSAAGGFLGTPAGKSLARLLKGAARKILPVVEQVAGAGDGPAGEFGGEGEMESREWEAAQTFVKLARDAAVNAAQSPPDADPAAVAKKAVADAAQVHAPALLTHGPAPRPPAGAPFPQPHPAGPPQPHHPCGCGGAKGRNSGRWVRRGNQIFVFGI